MLNKIIIIIVLTSVVLAKTHESKFNYDTQFSVSDECFKDFYCNDIKIDKDDYFPIKLTLALKISSLMGEAVVKAQAKYTIDRYGTILIDGKQYNISTFPDEIIDKLRISGVEFKVKLKASSQRGLLTIDIDPGVFGKQDKWSLNSPVSPSWDNWMTDSNGHILSKNETIEAFKSLEEIIERSYKLTIKYDVSAAKKYLKEKNTKKIQESIDQFEDMLSEMEDNNLENEDSFESSLETIDENIDLDSLEENIEDSDEELLNIENKEERINNKKLLEKRISPYKNEYRNTLEGCEKNKPINPPVEFECSQKKPEKSFRGFRLSVKKVNDRRTEEEKLRDKIREEIEAMERKEREERKAREARKKEEKRKKLCNKEKSDWEYEVEQYPIRLNNWKEQRASCRSEALNRYNNHKKRIKKELQEIDSLLVD